MALPLPSGLTPSEVSFLCEMELVTVVPRQRLESIDLLTVSASQIASASLDADLQHRAQHRPSDHRIEVIYHCG
jgi:hypothetical protein